MRNDAMTLRLEEAMRFAAQAHAGQLRKGSDTPYFEHVAAVALILDRAGFRRGRRDRGAACTTWSRTRATSFEEVARTFRRDRIRASFGIAPKSRPTSRATSGPGSTASETTLPPWLLRRLKRAASFWPTSFIT